MNLQSNAFRAFTQQCQLGELLEFRNDIVHPRDNPKGKAVFVGLEHIERDTGIRTGSVQIELNEMTGRRARFCSGDIVYGYLRPYLNKVWIADFDGLCSVDQYVFTVKPEFDRNYVAHFLRSNKFLKTAPIDSAPGQLPRIRSGEIAATLIPLPPLDEQRRIAAILDKADALRRKRKRALELLDSLLVARFVELFGHPGENSKNLATISLGQLGKWQSGGTPPRSQAAYFGGGIKWFSSGDLEKKFAHNSSETITREALIYTSAKSVPSGALMLGMYDTAALKSTITTEDCSCNQAVAFASIDSDIAITEYVYHAIQIGREHFRRKQRGVRQKNLNLSLVREIEIPLPPMSDQALFLSNVKAIEVANSGAAAFLTQQDQLFASLQHRAFSSQL